MYLQTIQISEGSRIVTPFVHTFRRLSLQNARFRITVEMDNEKYLNPELGLAGCRAYQCRLINDDTLYATDDNGKTVEQYVDTVIAPSGTIWHLLVREIELTEEERAVFNQPTEQAE